jgi:hypothetical protein
VPEETAVATREESAIGVYGEPVGISGEADASDFVIPYTKLVQDTTETAKAGWFASSNGEQSEYVDMVVLHIGRTRTFYDNEQGLVCSSSDRRTGRPKIAKSVADDAVEGEPYACATCPWFKEEYKGCQNDYALTCFNLDTQEPFMFRVKGSARGVFRYRVISRVSSGKVPPWFGSFQMTAVKKSNDRKQSWWAPELQLTETYDGTRQAEWAAYAQQFGKAPVHDDEVPFE